MGTLILVLVFFVGVSAWCGVAVARRARPIGISLLQIALLCFAFSYVFGAQFSIWSMGASLQDQNSLLHAFGPGGMPSTFLSYAQIMFVPILAISVVAFGVARHRYARTKPEGSS
jgi:hypothetical protein